MAQDTSESKLSHYQLQRATPEDADAIQACNKKAFATSYLHEQLFPKDRAHLTSQEELFEWRVSRLRKTMHADDILYFKVSPFDEPERVIGYAGWYKPGHFRDKTLSDTFEKSAELESAENIVEAVTTAPAMLEPVPTTVDQKAEVFPACMDLDIYKHFLTKMDEERKGTWGDDVNYWYLAALGVDPDYQRQGIASRLMKEGLSRADADGLSTYLEATPDGALMYPKFGFRKVSEYSYFDGRHVVQFHVRSPSPKP